MRSSVLRTSPLPSGCQITSKAINSLEDIDPSDCKVFCSCSLLFDSLRFVLLFDAMRRVTAMYSLVASAVPEVCDEFISD